MFGSDGGSLIDGVNGRLLVAPGSAPAYSAAHLTVAQANGNGLRSDLMDTVSMQRTMACVVRDPGAITGLVLSIGSLSTTQGVSLFRTTVSGNILTTARTITGFTSADSGRAMTANSWLFVALSMDFSATTKVGTLLRGGGAAVSMSGTGTFIPQTAGGIALGGSYYSSGVVQNMDFAEAVLFDRAMTATELGNLYVRSKSRMAARGIAVL